MEFSDHPEQQVQQYISIFLTNIIRFIQLAIPVVTRFSNEQPTLFLAIVSVIAAYIAFRVIRNMFTILKRLLYVLCLLCALFVYLRGFEQFFKYDLPLLYNLISQDKDLETVLIQWGTYLTSTSVTSSTFIYKFAKAKVLESIKNFA